MKDTKRNKDDRNSSKDALDNFVLIDEAIDLSTQEEYFSFSETIDFDNVDLFAVLFSFVVLLSFSPLLSKFLQWILRPQLYLCQNV
jgi:hypothetical protein